MSRRLVARLSALATLLSAAPAPAAPSVWQRAERAARGEDVARLEDAYAKALDLETKALMLSGERADVLGDDLRLKATFLLVAAGAARSDDARVLRLLGGLYASLQRCEQAVPVLRRAIALAPASSLDAPAWFEIAICASHDGDRRQEAASYERALAVADDPHLRAMTESNLAEARMGLGDLRGAIDAAERSIAIEDDNPAAYWNLAILRDRTDDELGALAAATDATSLDPDYGFLDGPGVFFTPDYDRHWYHALGELARAERDVGNAPARKLDLEAAKDEYDAWLAKAGADDRFRPMATARAQRIAKQLAALPKANAKPKK